MDVPGSGFGDEHFCVAVVAMEALAEFVPDFGFLGHFLSSIGFSQQLSVPVPFLVTIISLLQTVQMYRFPSSVGTLVLLLGNTPILHDPVSGGKSTASSISEVYDGAIANHHNN